MSRYKTPLRYPGGKQRLTPFILEILKQNDINGHYIEPYAGGAGVAMELLLSRNIHNIHINDSYTGIYAFWYSVIHHTEELCKKIVSATLSVPEWRKHQEIVKKADSSNLLELGFSVFYLNRCNRSGVLSAGVIGGLNQDGNYKIGARFNKSDLISRIESIGIYKNNIFLTNLDAEVYIENYIPNLANNNSLVYLDPPYYNKASQLYLNSYQKDDHRRIAQSIQQNINQNWILSYDGVPEILELYYKRRHFLYDLQYSVQTVKKGKEVFVFDDNLALPEICSLPHVNTGLQNLVTR